MIPGRLVLLGHPVTHTVSPRMQNAALAEAGLDIRYEAIDVEPALLSSVVRGLAEEGAAGNVTRPFKRAVFELCDVVTAVAARSAAVNTFWFEDRMLHGDNTDVAGFQRAASTLVHDRFEGLVTLFGSGGAAAGVLEALSSWANVRVDLVARNRVVGEELAMRYSDFTHYVELTKERLREARLVVNATPIGQSDDAVPFDVNDLSPAAKVFDLVYRRGGTMLVRRALAEGHEAVDGTMMLVEQGALSFERWFGFAPDRNAMQLAIA
jgi:shikimate dehydrogenase